MPAARFVGMPCCARVLEGHPFHVAGDKYIRAVSAGAGAVPILVPAFGDGAAIGPVLDRLDGLLLTGSPSNVSPHRYQGAPSEPGTLHDEWRDAVTMPLIREAIARGMPVIGICRGIQELNVALGGTLHQRVHEVPGLFDHRAVEQKPVSEQYEPVHTVRLTPGGLFQDLADQAGITGDLHVNSLHGQGIDRLAPGLVIEAVAPDGLVEAVRSTGAGFAVGVQWHPEWRFWDNPFSIELFARFGAAVAAYAAAKVAAFAIGRPLAVAPA